VRLYFHPDFQNPMFEAIPDRVPAFKGMLLNFELTKPMYDSEILYELGHPEPYYPEDFAAIMSYLVSRQMDKEGGVLLTDGCDNIFYLQLEQKKVFMVRLYWHVTNNRWSLGMCDLNNIGRHQGDRVFSRS